MPCIFILYNKWLHNWTLFFGSNTICNLLQFFWELFANIVRKCGITYSRTNILTRWNTCSFYQYNTKFVKWNILTLVGRKEFVARPPRSSYALRLFSIEIFVFYRVKDIVLSEVLITRDNMITRIVTHLKIFNWRY